MKKHVLERCVLERAEAPAIKIVNIGSKVWFRGKVAKTFSARGVVECIDNNFGYGVRLENGNFQWVDNDQVKTR